MKYQLLKFRFVDELGRGERMWVKLYEDGTAYLDNEPIFLTNMQAGDEVDVSGLELLDVGETSDEIADDILKNGGL